MRCICASRNDIVGNISTIKVNNGLHWQKFCCRHMTSMPYSETHSLALTCTHKHITNQYSQQCHYENTVKQSLACVFNLNFHVSCCVQHCNYQYLDQMEKCGKRKNKNMYPFVFRFLSHSFVRSLFLHLDRSLSNWKFNDL